MESNTSLPRTNRRLVAVARSTVPLEEINKTSHEASREKIGAAETSLAVTSLGGQEKTVNEGKLSTINPLRGIERKNSKKAHR